MSELRWNQHPERVAKVLAKAGPIPCKYNLTPVAAFVEWDDYNRIVKGNVDEEYSNPYIFCAMGAIAVVQTEILGPDDQIYFLFDRQEGLRRGTMTAIRDTTFEWFGADSRYRGLDFIPRRTTVCLDPADYLAYIMRENAIAPDSEKVKMGESIVDRKVRGGKIPAEYLRWHVAQNGRPDGLERAIEGIVQQPFFRGPR